MRLQHWIYTVPLRLRSLFRRRQVEQELDEELQYHLERETEEFIAQGLSPEEARYAALRAMEGLDQQKEQCRDLRRVNYIENFFQDFRYGFRVLAKKPAFTAMAVITLALGIGANTAIFSVMNTVLLRPLQFKDPKRLVMIFQSETDVPLAPVTGPDYLDWRSQAKSFKQIAAYNTYFSFNLTGKGEPEHLQAGCVSYNFFSTLGIAPVLGRTFLGSEDQPGKATVALLAHRLWQRCFNSDPKVIGQAITLDNQPFTIVGVVPASFPYPFEDVDVWVPLWFKEELMTRRGDHWMWVIGRLNPEVSVQQSEAEMNTISARLQKQYPQTNSQIGSLVLPWHDQMVRGVQPVLLMLMAAVALLLLIACVNLANLLMARSEVRKREMAIRTAVGAGRLRLIRLLLSESLLLALLGGILGLLLAWGGKHILVALSPGDIPRLGETRLDLATLIFTLGVALMTGIAFGLAPALQTSKLNLNEALKEGMRSSSAGAGSHKLRSLLVVIQVALALMLLVGTGLMVRSLGALVNVKAGFDPRNVLTALVSWPDFKYPNPEQRLAFYDQGIDKIRALPGVEVVAATSKLPLLGGSNSYIWAEGQPVPRNQNEGPLVEISIITPEYFRTMRIPLLKGRFFTEGDNLKSPKVVLINERMARLLWPNQDPIGKHVTFTDDNPPAWREVVGVVGDVRQWGLGSEAISETYLPYAQYPQSRMYLVVRTAQKPETLASAIRHQVLAVDRDQPLHEVRTMERIVDDSASGTRFRATLMTTFGGLALLLAAVGIYGVITHWVTRRTHEIGIRMALGAKRRDVLKLVAERGMILAMAGVAAGMILAFAFTRFLAVMLYGVQPTDLLTFAGASLLLTAVAALACYIPARRAAKVDPMVALRYE